MARRKAVLPEEGQVGAPTFGGPVVLVWLERLERLFGMPEGHEGVAERIKVYQDKVHEELGRIPENKEDVLNLIYEIRSNQ